MDLNNLTTYSNFSPVIAPSFQQENDEQFKERWRKFDALPNLKKQRLSSEKTFQIIERLGELFKLELSQIACVSRAIRNYYFGDIKLEDFPNIFVSEMGVDEPTAKKISQMVIQQIIRDDSYEKAYLAKIEKAPFNEALRKYPSFGEQLITSERIKIPGFPEPVRPSIKNWIADCTGMASYEKGNVMMRQEYVFKNPNTRNLNPKDRTKLSFILRSFDENSEVAFNKDTKLLIFEEIKNTPPQSSAPAESSISFTTASQKKEHTSEKKGELHFSYPQKMPFEKNYPPTQENQPIHSPSSVPTGSSEPTSPSGSNNIVKIPPKTAPTPKNIVNLKDFQL